MNTNEIRIRTVTEEDADKLLEVYAPYIKNTAITFEYEVPSVSEFRKRILHTLHNYPYIAAECENRILGYAYAGTFIGRAACDWSVEVSIYLRKEEEKRGLGRMLYGALEEILKLQHIQNVNACVACTDTEDEYLTNNSIRFHRHMGYREVGRFNRCGYKFGRWYDLAWLEKHIGTHSFCPEPVISYPEIDRKQIEEVLTKW